MEPSRPRSSGGQPPEEERLAKLLRPAGVSSSSGPLDDSVFDQIALEMKVVGLPKEWVSRPRTHFILHQIKRTKLMGMFIFQGYDDTCIPYANRSALPQTESQSLNPFEAKAFLEWQSVCKSPRLQLEKGNHCKIDDGDILFENSPRPRILGNGSEMRTVVDEVISKTTGRVYARKRITRRKLPREAQKAFESELRALTKVKNHEHLIQVCGMYTDKKYFALLLEPVADRTLKQYLSSGHPKTQTERSILCTYFGCMAKVMDFLHESEMILHKDIKLENFLLKNGRLILTDFGTAFDFSETGHSMTMANRDDARTHRYSSPEVANEGRFHRASDIWSLGVVYLEMTTVLHGKKLAEFDLYLNSHGTRSTRVHANREAVLGWFQELKSQTFTPADNEPLAWVQRMLERAMDSRPTAVELYLTVRSSQNGRFCGSCCLEQESETESESSQSPFAK
ncbi:serine/threonine protein kinase [Cladophialophora psammophila CBS 110553]|uniref:Serine/threonine protein kinase n=1 Tax=Cladophialophora psammophila CBS 110553 TaxID=1182543 RepID=W9WP06_9EURO|nr:serine/threonine protein kinase [Cladophialophora psammophila CBS 110553]EXJ66366.1 serine/threonine protein kinase [Cladophialophora psammophila CBS 110553]